MATSTGISQIQPSRLGQEPNEPAHAWITPPWEKRGFLNRGYGCAPAFYKQLQSKVKVGGFGYHCHGQARGKEGVGAHSRWQEARMLVHVGRRIAARSCQELDSGGAREKGGGVSVTRQVLITY